MDYSPIVNEVLRGLWWLVPVALVIGFFQSRWFKGALGEALVKFAAKLRLPADTYHRIHNVTLSTPDGTTQIDHVFVSRFGIFVVETKNMKGWIFGGENQAHWTQKIFKKSFKFQNPLRQNYKHVKALEAALDVPPEVIHSVVVFAGESTFKSPMPANVTRGGGYITYVKSFRQPVLSESEVQGAVSQIQTGRLEPSRQTHRLHVQQLKTRSNPFAERKCPKCGSSMVLRTAKRGANAGNQFWGCSTYPKCRVVQNLT
ncbi:nuclease-related domain-containing protein [Salinisphaera sp.]|uniref:nuclease-related domain-containing protein n=1 Tax=Salinisphaera sp. TaxID=1914330 RepID=UPI002D780D66|nr:NERD domain-containing protein [Salinisphaera sp.]HET7315167.1 NERD domain-containing protein [Salinisphaera sp.]